MSSQLEKNLVEELEIGIATGLGAQKTKVGAGSKEEAFAFSRPCFRYLLLAVCLACAAFTAFALHSRFVITITTREAYQREKHHRHDNHKCAARLINVENQLEARYERDHYRALLAKHFHKRGETAGKEFLLEVQEWVADAKYSSVDPSFKDGVMQMVTSHVERTNRRGRKLFKSIADDELDASKNEKALQRDIEADLANEAAEAEEFSGIHDKHYGDDDTEFNAEGQAIGSVDGHNHDHSDDDDLVVKGEVGKQARQFFANVREYQKLHLKGLKVRKSDLLYKSLKSGALRMLNGNFTERAMVEALGNSTQDLAAAGLKPYNRELDGEAADYIFNAIQMLTLHTHMDEIWRIERNFTSGKASGTEVMQALSKLQQKGVVPAELFAMDYEADDPLQLKEGEEDGEEDPFKNVPDREYQLSDENDDDALDDQKEGEQEEKEPNDVNSPMGAPRESVDLQNQAIMGDDNDDNNDDNNDA